MFGLIQEIFIGLLTSIGNASNHANCVSLSNQKCTTQPTLINLHPNEYTQGSHYYPFALTLNRYLGILFMTYLIKFVFQTKQKM